MSHVKVICCLHATQNFYDLNKEYLVNLNKTFQCACKDTYGSHQLYFYVCVDCYKDLLKKGYNIGLLNNKCLKFCILRSNLDILNFRDNVRFFSFNDIIEIAPIFWNYREHLIKVK